MNVRGRAKYEIVVVVIVIALAIAVAAGLYAARSKVFNGKRMIAELSTLRAGVALYMDINKERPPDLETLFNTTYDAGYGQKRPYVENVPTNDKGQPVDPFGKPYVYDPKRVMVSSVSSGYENW